MKGTTVMFDVDRILKVGGAESYDRDHPAKDNSYVIDFSNENNVTVTPTVNRLTYSRTMHNSTVLPNGEVLVTGGLDHAEVFSDVGARLTAEIYNPESNTWRTVAGMQVPRTYHSVAILMVDGRVFVGGGGLCDNSNPAECVNHTDAEIYSPSYLFNNDGSLATRPTISAPETADYNTSIPVTGSSGITDFNLIRFSSATHSTNNEQRRIPVSFTGNGSYTVNIPDRNLLPPGYYMLFGLNANGVPSVAETIQIGNSIPLSEDPSIVLDLKFDEGSGSVARDDSQYGNNATIYDVDNRMANKTPSTGNWGSGLFGGALETDGVEFQSNTIVDVPTSASMQTIANTMTVMAWVNRDDIVYNASVFTHDYPAFFFGFHNSLYKWEIYTSEGVGSCLAGYTPTSQWVHIAATYDGQMARLYANGQEVCSKPVTGNLVLNTAEANFSSFTTSGFYERRTNPASGYNGSGVTDELDGRIDEVKVFNRVLNAGQVKFYYDQGVGLTGVPDCPQGTLVVEYRHNGGEWTTGNTLNAELGDEVYIRARDYSGQYYLTTPIAYSPTFNSTDPNDFSAAFGAYLIDTNLRTGLGRTSQNNDGQVDSNSAGQYVLTTPGGCIEVFTLTFDAPPVDCTAGSIIPEYRLDGVWDSGENYVTVTEGTEVMFSMLPNNIGVTVTLPNGTVVGDDYNLGNVTVANSGVYTIVSAEGCETFVELTVTPNCAGTPIQAEYQVDGGSVIVGPSANIDQGGSLRLGIQVDGLAFSISGPNGNTKGLDTSDLVLADLTLADSGTYTISSAEGCQTTFTLTVVELPAGCDPLPGTWVNSDIGAVGATGSVCYDNGTFEVAASGADIWGAVDEFHYVYQPLAGDGEIIARVVSLENTDPWAKAGVMMRNTLDANSAMILMSVSPNPDRAGSIGYSLQQRNTAGQTMTTADNNLGPVAIAGYPYYVRLVRQGNTFAGYASATNGNWTLLGSRTISMNSTIYVGLATTSHRDGRLGTSVYDNVQLVTPCPVGTTILSEYRVNGGSPNVGNMLTLDLGTSLSLGIQVEGLAFSISGPNGNAKGPDTMDLLLENVTVADAGIYVISSEEGCDTTFELNVIDTCVSGIIPEYQLDGVWESGENFLTVTEGIEVVLSMLPNNIGVTVTLPDGTVAGDNYSLGNVTPADNGRYTLTSEEGCETFIELAVTPYCETLGLQTEYQINAEEPVFGATTVSVTEGETLRLSMLPDDLAYSIDGPNGNIKDLNISDLVLENITLADSGTYSFVTEAGCEVRLEVNVAPFDCASLELQTVYRLNGTNPVVGAGSVVTAEGATLSLGIQPDGLAFSIVGPNGNSKDLGTSELLLENLTPADSGMYVFTTAEGCEISLTLTVEAFDCETLGLQTEYQINAEEPVFGATTVSVTEGETLRLSMLPDDLAYSIDGPNGNIKDLNISDLVLENITLADSGTYSFVTEAGCEVRLEVNVAPFDCASLELQTVYRLNGTNPVVGASSVVTAEGATLSLGIQPDGLAFSIVGPNGNSKDLGTSELLLENLTPADSGMYVFTTAEGCEISLTLTVEAFDCETLGLQTEYRLGGANPVVGAVALTATVGQSLVLGIKPDGLGFSVSGPNGNNKGVNLTDLVVESLTLADSGTYFFRTAEGCEIQFSLIVQEGMNPNEPGDIDSIVIYPNPITNGELTLYLKEFMNFELNAVIYDIKGRSIYQKIISADHGEEEVLQLSQLSTGVYMLNIQVWRTGQYTIKKVVKMR